MKLSVLCLGVKNCYVTINSLLHNKCITKQLKCLLELSVTWFSPRRHVFIRGMCSMYSS